MNLYGVDWQIAGCAIVGCERSAELLYDGEPLCVLCADALLERQVALETAPRSYRELLMQVGFLPPLS